MVCPKVVVASSLKVMGMRERVDVQADVVVLDVLSVVEVEVLLVVLEEPPPELVMAISAHVR